MQRQAQRGFTLVELLIVMLVIAILAGLAIPRFARTREQAYRNTMVADLKNLSSQQEIYHLEHTTYAGSLEDLGIAPSRSVTLDITDATPTGWAATAAHSALEGTQCGVFHGSAAAAAGAPALTAGVITCDETP